MRSRVRLQEKVIVWPRTLTLRQEERHPELGGTPPILLQSGTQARLSLLQTLHLLPLPGPVKPTLATPPSYTLSIGHRRIRSTSLR